MYDHSILEIKICLNQMALSKSTSSLGDLDLTCSHVPRLLLFLFMWCSSFGPRHGKKVLSNVRKMRILKASCECAKYHPGLCSPFMHSVKSDDSGSGHWV